MARRAVRERKPVTLTSKPSLGGLRIETTSQRTTGLAQVRSETDIKRDEARPLHNLVSAKTKTRSLCHSPNTNTHPLSQLGDC